MSELAIQLPRQVITAAQVVNALNAVVVRRPGVIEQPEPKCDWHRLCGESCRFPRYFRAGGPSGLVANVLIGLGYPVDLLKALDHEFEIGEVLHPGVKIGRSRNAALSRIDSPGVSLLAFLQDSQKLGRSWSRIATDATRPAWMITYLDKRRRPWLY